jgi:hypothetical protein
VPRLERQYQLAEALKTQRETIESVILPKRNLSKFRKLQANDHFMHAQAANRLPIR